MPAALLVGAPPRVLLDVVWVPIAITVGLVTLLAGVVAAPVLWGFESVLSGLPTPVPTPSAVPAPGWFSTTTGWPNFFARRSAIMRELMSKPEPAATGTMKRIAREG